MLRDPIQCNSRGLLSKISKRFSDKLSIPPFNSLKRAKFKTHNKLRLKKGLFFSSRFDLLRVFANITPAIFPSAGAHNIAQKYSLCFCAYIMLECTHLYNLCFCAEMKKFKCDDNKYKYKKQKGGMVMIVAEHKNESTPTIKKEFRTSVTVFKDDFDIFKDICKAKYDKDPVNSGIKEAIAVFIRENKQYLEPKYSQMKEWFE